MDFGLSEDQVLLEKTVKDFLANQVPIERVRALREEACPLDRALWLELAELGVTGALVSEDLGGSGLSLLDASLIAHAMGEAVTPAPFLSTAVMAPIALRALPGRDANEWLSGIAAGELVFGTAFVELFSRREDAGVRIDAGRLYGKSMMALDACVADWILVAIDPQTLAIVGREAAGVDVTRLQTTDATRCTAEVFFEGVQPQLISTEASEAIANALVAGRIGLAADSLGAAQSMIDQAVRYAGERKQFERVIGSFQAVKHLCAEMIAELEPARSLLWYAAHSFDAVPEEAALMSCHALSHLSEIGREIASISTQVHGGIGWTDEQNLHFWFKRIGVARHLLGGPEFLREEAARLQGFVEDA